MNGATGVPSEQARCVGPKPSKGLGACIYTEEEPRYSGSAAPDQSLVEETFGPNFKQYSERSRQARCSSEPEGTI